jgi:hypothetical protein
MHVNLYLFMYFVSFSMYVGSDYMRIEKGLDIGEPSSVLPLEAQILKAYDQYTF